MSTSVRLSLEPELAAGVDSCRLSLEAWGGATGLATGSLVVLGVGAAAGGVVGLISARQDSAWASFSGSATGVPKMVAVIAFAIETNILAVSVELILVAASLISLVLSTGAG